MNADILKPFLEELASAFPGQEVGVALQLSRGSDSPSGKGPYQATVTLPNQYYWAETLDEAIAKAKSDFTPEKVNRQNVAKKLREQADRIAAGTEPIPDAV